MIDIIGDIHGHADELQALLKKLGYTKKGHSFSHPERKALFVGDYVDRGQKIRETLEIVRTMVESDHAIALMGNHEYNALCFHFENKNGGHLRTHSIKNIIQHYDTLKQFQNSQSEYENYLEWFKSLPLYYETDNFRAAHACWDYKSIDFLRKNLVNNRLTDELIYQSVKEGTALNLSIEHTLKGKELRLPKGVDFTDKDGTTRTDIRIKWWENSSDMTYKSISVEGSEIIPEIAIDSASLNTLDHYLNEDKKVFFGHYWLNGKPSILKSNICCLDYSVANGGNLVAYRLDDKEYLSNDNLVFV